MVGRLANSRLEAEYSLCSFASSGHLEVEIKPEMVQWTWKRLADSSKRSGQASAVATSFKAHRVLVQFRHFACHGYCWQYFDSTTFV